MFKKVFKGGGSKEDDNRRKVMVLSADSGLVGRAILPGLATHRLLDVYAGVSDPNRFGEMEGVTVLKIDMEDTKGIHKAFKSKKFDRVVIVVPGNRPDWAENILEAADYNKYVKFVVLISLNMAAYKNEDSFFAVNYKDMEKAAKHYFPFGHCIVRLPLLMDAMIPLCAQSIVEDQSFKDPRDPEKPFRCVALSDVAKAVLRIIQKPTQHEEKIYNLVGPSVTLNQQAKALSKALKKKIELVPEHYEQYQETLEDARVPEWSISGTFEIYRLIDEESEITNRKDGDDFEKITGEKPMTLEEFCKANKAEFQ